MMFTCKILDQRIVDDLIAADRGGAVGFVSRQYSKYLVTSLEHLIAVETALKQNDSISAREAVHKLGGLSGSLGVITVNQLCYAIELKLSALSVADVQDDIDMLARLMAEARIEVEGLISAFN